MEFTNINLNKKVCRTCLHIDNSENLHNVFSKENSDEIIPVTEMLAECSNCPITEGDAYPSQICSKCLEVVKIAYNFRKQCEKSYDILTAIINNCRNNQQNSGAFLESRFVSELLVKSEDTGAEVILYYSCEKCEEKFFSVQHLKKHIKESHNEKKCRICSKIFTRINLEETTDSSTKSPDYLQTVDDVCESCVDFYSQSDEINNFEEDENKDGSDIPWQYMCGVCNETFSTEDLLKNHPCEENCDTSIKSEKSCLDASFEEAENPLGEEIFSITNRLINSETDGFDIRDDYRDQDECSSTSDSKLLLELKGKPGSSAGMIKKKSGKKYKKSVSKIGRIPKCDVCDKVFSRSTHLRRHSLTHSGVKPFSCKVCNKSFTRMDHLNIHMHHHSDIKPHVCEICKRGFTRAEHLRKHKDSRHGDKMKTPKTEFCDICKKGFTTVKYLHIHMKSHTDRIWGCKTCPEKFKTKPELTAHLKIHAASEKPYLCSECGLRFVRNDYLVIHMRRHKGEKPYKCKFCGKGFPRATDLTVHERYHTGEKTHLCTICGKGFQRAYNLLVHMRVHTGERPYQCPHCSKRFAQGNDLKAHIRRHTGERFKCEICGDGFIQGYHLTQHKRNVHGIDMKSHIRRVEKFVTVVDQKQQIEVFQTACQLPKLDPDGTENLGENAKEQPTEIAEVEVIKIEEEQAEELELETEAISLNSEQAEMLEIGHEITVVDGASITRISYFSSPEGKVKLDSSSE